MGIGFSWRELGWWERSAEGERVSGYHWSENELLNWWEVGGLGREVGEKVQMWGRGSGFVWVRVCVCVCVYVCVLLRLAEFSMLRQKCRSGTLKVDTFRLIQLLVTTSLVDSACISLPWSCLEGCLGHCPELKYCTEVLQGQSLCHHVWLPKTSRRSELYSQGDYSDSELIFGLQWIGSCGSVFQLFKRQRFWPMPSCLKD